MKETMTEKDREGLLLKRAKQSLEESAERLDGKTLERLRQIRQSAVEEAFGKKRRPFFEFPRLAMAGGFVTVAAAAFVLFLWLHAPQTDIPVKTPEDFEIILAKDQIELYEDLDFYDWLAASENSG
jgi:hypothetical protein